MHNPLIQSAPATKTLWVAYSGGLDSSVLLHAVRAYSQQNNVLLRALHIQHGLHPDAEAWAQHCRQTCANLGIELKVLHISIRDTQRNLENQARDARYSAFSESLADGDTLAMAHHQDDVAETLLLRLIRGSGTQALANMQTHSRRDHYYLWRPLLNHSRPELLSYAQHHQLAWIEDSSNTDTRHDRNFLRHDILPRLAARFPQINQSLAQSAQFLASDAELLQPIISHAYAQCQRGAQLDLPALLTLDKTLQAHVLRYWLEQHTRVAPGARALHEFLMQLTEHQSDDATQLDGHNYSLSVWQSALYLRAKNAGTHALGEFDMRWDGAQALNLPRGGVLRWHGIKPCITQVRYRIGGERMQLAGQAMHHQVKKCLSTRIPPWQREALPFVYNEHNELLAVGDVLISEHLQQLQLSQNCRLEWQHHNESET